MELIDKPTTEDEQMEMNRAQVTGKPSAIVDNDDVVELGVDEGYDPNYDYDMTSKIKEV